MTHEALMKRFQRFRQEYFDTSEGRQHRQNHLQEQKDVQAIFERLRAEQQQGVDVTDEVLKCLLPYAEKLVNDRTGQGGAYWQISLSERASPVGSSHRLYIASILPCQSLTPKLLIHTSQ